MGSDELRVGPGDVVAGRYRIDGLLGRGGYGVVFRATQLPMGRPVALKMLLVEALAQGDGRARFRREAELAQRLQHPNTVRLHDFGESEAGLPFIAWELLEGRALDAAIRADGPLAPARVAWIAAQALQALAEAHALGIVHRDIKPSNIFLCEVPGEPSFVKVLDFGIAKNTLAHGTALTREGSVVGTPAYMAPEHASGAATTPAIDLYALGLVMAEMLTGRPVFPGDDALAVLMAQLSDARVPLPPAVLASPLGPVIARATEKPVALRFASAQEMLQHLSAIGGAAATAPPLAAAAAEAAALASAPTAYAMPAPGAPEAGAVPPTLVIPAVENVPAAPPPARARRGPLVLAVIGGAVVVLVGLLLARRGTLAQAMSRGDGDKPAIVATPGKRFAVLTGQQIRARIEQAGFRVADERTSEATTTWVLAGIGRYVILLRAADPSAAEAAEHLYTKQAGVTARDGNAVLHVELHDATNARQLMDQIAR